MWWNTLLHVVIWAFWKNTSLSRTFQPMQSFRSSEIAGALQENIPQSKMSWKQPAHLPTYHIPNTEAEQEMSFQLPHDIIRLSGFQRQHKLNEIQWWTKGLTYISYMTGNCLQDMQHWQTSNIPQGQGEKLVLFLHDWKRPQMKKNKIFIRTCNAIQYLCVGVWVYFLHWEKIWIARIIKFIGRQSQWQWSTLCCDIVYVTLWPMLVVIV